MKDTEYEPYSEFCCELLEFLGLTMMKSLWTFRLLFSPIQLLWLYFVVSESAMGVDCFAFVGMTPSAVALIPNAVRFRCYPIALWERRHVSASQQHDRDHELLEDSSETPNFLSSPSFVTTFNPFAYDASSVTGSKPLKSPWRSNERSTTNNIISLRSTRMKQITDEMLNSLPDRDKILNILQSNKDFILEPLEDAMAVQDVDSIYIHCTSRTERYRVFEQSMMDRLNSVRNESVRQVLSVLKDFVLSHEHLT